MPRAGAASGGGAGALNEGSHLDLFGRGERDEIEFMLRIPKRPISYFFALFKRGQTVGTALPPILQQIRRILEENFPKKNKATQKMVLALGHGEFGDLKRELKVEEVCKVLKRRRKRRNGEGGHFSGLLRPILQLRKARSLVCFLAFLPSPQ